MQVLTFALQFNSLVRKLPYWSNGILWWHRMKTPESCKITSYISFACRCLGY